MLEDLPGDHGLNIAHEAVDRHAVGPLANHLALRWIGKNGIIWDFTYAALQRETGQFANVLTRLGVGKGDRVFALLGRIPETGLGRAGPSSKGAPHGDKDTGLDAHP